METKKTYYDGLKAKVTIKQRSGGRGPRFDWKILDNSGQTMAAGEEFSLDFAVNTAREAVGALRTWSVFSRGAVIPANDGRRWFAFVSTEHSSVHFDIPSRESMNNLAELTKAIKEGKVKS